MSRDGLAARKRADIHPTAVVHPGARLSPSVVVGAFAVIGPDVVIGPGSRIGHHVVIEGPTRIGAANVFHPFAVIGGDPQDRRYSGEETRLEIGDRNVFREFVTVNRGTVDGGGATIVGSGNLFMAYVHVAHDCRVGSHVVFANGATLAGHVTVADHVVFGGLAAVGQFRRIGESAMVAAGAMVESDVPPFCVAQGDRARVRGLNLVGLGRRGFSKDEIAGLKRAYRRIFLDRAPRKVALDKLDRGGNQDDLVRKLVAFLASSQTRAGHEGAK